MTGSIVLAADEPAALARFYGAFLEVEPQQGLSPSHWRLSWPAGWRCTGHRAAGRSLASRDAWLSACNVRRMEQAPLRCSTPGSAGLFTWGPPRWIRRDRNPSGQKPGCSIRRATAYCCWCCPDGRVKCGYASVDCNVNQNSMVNGYTLGCRRLGAAPVQSAWQRITSAAVRYQSRGSCRWSLRCRP
jgi:hypothetical protein